ncbi:MAG: hypothetical protein ABSG43_25105, partial [Solirubrobacteraceae bacterium]
MSKVAAQRLIDAAAALEPADRALLNLWINRGLDDAAVARMTHADSASIAARRSELVESLSRIVGLPPDEVHASLDELAAAARAESTAPAQPQPPVERPSAGHQPPTGQQQLRGARRSESRRRRRRRSMAAAILLAVVIVVAVVLLLVGGHGGGDRASVTSAPAQLRTLTLVGLPGGPAGVGGTVTVVGTERLRLTVHGLPSRPDGHYELWLYNSILDAIPIATLSAP